MNRHLIVATICWVCVVAPSEVSAQSCKPDVSKEDRISKERVDIWAQELFATGFGASLMSTSEVNITATIGRYGALNAINLQLQKREESATNASFETAYRGAQGRPFYFGFKTGDPVALVVTDVRNESSVDQGVFADKRGVTTVILSAVVQDKDMSTLRNALTSRQIDAVRIMLAGNAQVEKSVSDKNGKKMMEKFSCSYQALDKRGIDLTAVAIATPAVTRPYEEWSVSKLTMLKPVGNYVRVTAPWMGPASNMPFVPDDCFGSVLADPTSPGTHYLLWVPKALADEAAKYPANSTVTVEGEAQKRGPSGVLAGIRVHRFVGDSGAPAPPATTPGALTVDQIIQMVGAKLTDDVIITTMRKSGSKFDLSPEVLIKLKAAGVSDAIIRAMTGGG